MKKFIIWNSDFNEEDFYEAIKETCEENNVDFDTVDLWNEAYEMNSSYLGDERMNLDISIPNGTIALADIGRWDGRVHGYKKIGNNISDCLYTEMDGVEWYVDTYGVFRARMYDHDGTTFVVYKAWKNNVTKEQKERVLNAIYMGSCSDRTLRRYTRNIGKDIAKVYGWKVRG